MLMQSVTAIKGGVLNQTEIMCISDLVVNVCPDYISGNSF